MGEKIVDMDKLKLKPVVKDLNQRNTRIFKKETVDIMKKIRKQNVERAKLKKYVGK